MPSVNVTLNLSLDDRPRLNPSSVPVRPGRDYGSFVGEERHFVQVYTDVVGSPVICFENPDHMEQFGRWLVAQADVVRAAREAQLTGAAS
jgi:hypothetical protein